jgi:hypothetical protein
MVTAEGRATGICRLRVLSFLFTGWKTSRALAPSTPLHLWPCLYLLRGALFLSWLRWNLSVRHRPLSQYKGGGKVRRRGQRPPWHSA